MIYFIQNELTKNVKIGHSDAVKTRLRQLQQGNDCPLKLVATIEGGAGVERQYHDAWHQYRIQAKGAHGDEWFSVDVYPTSGGGVRIIGRKLQRAKTKKRGVYRKQHCLRLTDEQEELLRRYTAFRGFATSVGAIRGMIDGLEDWFIRQEAKASSPAAQPIEAQEHSGLPEATDVEPTDVQSISRATDDIYIRDTDGDTSVGDFAGMPAVKLPESRHDGHE